MGSRHVHRTVDYTINSTRIVCNPKGYPGEDTDLIIDVKI